MAGVIPFLSTQTAEQIKALKRRGAATKQLVQDPIATITIMRSATEIVTTLTPIVITLANRDAHDVGTNAGLASTVQSGTFEAWADDAVNVRQGDRFTWQGQPCIVSTGPIASFGTVTIAFALDIRNRGV